MCVQRLASLGPSAESKCREALDPAVIDRNRCKDIVPLDNLSRPYLMCQPNGSSYINAVFTDGYKQRNAFILTQMPLPGTVADLWSLVHDHECRTIVMMNEMDFTNLVSSVYIVRDILCVPMGQ
jgi:protein tyrosine phosphatase